MKQNPVIEVKKLNGKEYIYFTFQGKFLEKDAEKAIGIWAGHFQKGNIARPHIWDCKEMTGYEPMARIIWQKAMKELKGNISKIWLISESPVILAGAKILSLFTSFDISPVKSENDIANSK
ncbi:MAG: hypothetical protein WC951_00515 [Bacteroidales bacterium]